MTHREWIELERIEKAGRVSKPYRRGPALLEKTRQEDEHPEWYNQACECRTCMSYADL